MANKISLDKVTNADTITFTKDNEGKANECDRLTIDKSKLPFENYRVTKEDPIAGTCEVEKITWERERLIIENLPQAE